MSAYSFKPGAEQRRPEQSGPATTARLILWIGATASLLDGMTTFAGLQRSGIAEANSFQALAIDRYGLPGVILLRMFIGATMFALLAMLFRYSAGWRRRLLLIVAVAGALATATFVVNNLAVLCFHHTLLPGSYLRVVYAPVQHLVGRGG